MNPKMTLEEFDSAFQEKYRSSPAEAYAFAQEVSENKAIKSPQVRQRANYQIAVDLFYSGRYEEAEAILKSYLFDYGEYPFKPFYIESFDLLSAIEYCKKRFHLSIFYGQQALALSEEKKCYDSYSMICSNLAAPYHELKDEDRCLDYLDKALSHLPPQTDPGLRASIIFNRSGVLLSLGRAEEAKTDLATVEAIASTNPNPSVFESFLPLCQAEVCLALHEETDLHAEALAFYHSPCQSDEGLFGYVLDDDESLYDLLRKNHLEDDAALFLTKIEEIQSKTPSLMTSIFLAKRHAEIALEKGEALAAGKYYEELAKLCQQQNEEFSKDFEEITKLHFDFVRVAVAYQKARKRARRLLEESDTDALTGLANRRSLEKEKKRFPSLAKKAPYFVLALLDFDHFKDVNDIYGYQSGDNALRLGGDLFKPYQSSTCRVFRYGGDEFIFALAVHSTEEAATFFAKLKNHLETANLRSGEGKKIALSCCIGYAVFNDNYETFSPALKAATEAIHAAKKIGRGNIVSVVC